MRYNLMFPMRAVKHWNRWCEVAGIGDIARLVEEAGFHAFSMSEHPYPDREWLARGGHHAFDPFVSLSFAAAATTRIRLMTYLLVPGYRNPYLAAKAAASFDLLSGGRFTLGTGSRLPEGRIRGVGSRFRAAWRATRRGDRRMEGDLGRRRPRRARVRGARSPRAATTADDGRSADLDRWQRRGRAAPGRRGRRRLDADGRVGRNGRDHPRPPTRGHRNTCRMDCRNQ